MAKILWIINAVLLIASLVGMAGIFRLRASELTHESEAEIWRTISECHEAADAARHDKDHAARGLTALADAMAYRIEAAIDSGAVDFSKIKLEH